MCGFHVTFVSTHLPAFLNDNNLEENIAGFALALIGLFNIFGTLSFGYLGSKVSKKIFYLHYTFLDLCYFFLL